MPCLFVQNSLFITTPLTMMIGSYAYSYSNAAALWSVACARSSTRDAVSSPEGKIFLNTKASLSIYCRVTGVEGSCVKRLA